MIYPNLNEEKKLWKKGYEKVVGFDEVGRGALAGPVIVCAVVLKQRGEKLIKFFNELVKNVGIKDSKKLSSQKREEIYKILTKSFFVDYYIGKASEKEIDKINILRATKLAMERAIKKIEKTRLKIDYLILDGKIKLDLPIPQKSIVKADEKVFSCACASIIAKVKRDKIMRRLHKKYPFYGFDRHKGYSTEFHKKMLKKYGPCQVHRRSFGMIKLIKD